MASIVYQERVLPDVKDVYGLYLRSGLGELTVDREKLFRSIQNSSFHVSAYDGELLIGYLRAVGDGERSMYLQEIVVDPLYRRRGIGSEMIRRFVNAYPSVKRLVAVTASEEKSLSFFAANRLSFLDEKTLVALVFPKR